MTEAIKILSEEQTAQFRRNGYIVVRGLFSPTETAASRDHFMAIHAAGPVAGYFDPVPLNETNSDILKHYPRIMQPHRWDEASMGYMLDARLESCLRDLFEEEVLAAQSMLYFKPPGARGQALHQDNFYLRVSPGTCIAAWLSLDDADEENGGMFVVPGSHVTGVQCPHPADLTKSFTIDEVNVPAGMQPVPVNLKSGDVMFFNGSVIHGSSPNTSAERFRRAFICHYVGASTIEMSHWYYPLHTFAGEPISRGDNPGGGPCGVEEAALLQTSFKAQTERLEAAGNVRQ